MANMHGDHVASCLCCSNFVMSFEGDYSEVTPGRGVYYECRAHKFLGLSPEETSLHEAMKHGVDCDAFQERNDS